MYSDDFPVGKACVSLHESYHTQRSKALDKQQEKKTFALVVKLTIPIN
jgi:hypothetical protein